MPEELTDSHHLQFAVRKRAVATGEPAVSLRFAEEIIGTARQVTFMGSPETLGPLGLESNSEVTPERLARALRSQHADTEQQVRSVSRVTLESADSASTEKRQLPGVVNVEFAYTAPAFITLGWDGVDPQRRAELEEVGRQSVQAALAHVTQAQGGADGLAVCSAIYWTDGDGDTPRLHIDGAVFAVDRGQSRLASPATKALEQAGTVREANDRARIALADALAPRQASEVAGLEAPADAATVIATERPSPDGRQSALDGAPSTQVAPAIAQDGRDPEAEAAWGVAPAVSSGTVIASEPSDIAAASTGSDVRRPIDALDATRTPDGPASGGRDVAPIAVAEPASTAAHEVAVVGGVAQGALSVTPRDCRAVSATTLLVRARGVLGDERVKEINDRATALKQQAARIEDAALPTVRADLGDPLRRIAGARPEPHALNQWMAAQGERVARGVAVEREWARRDMHMLAHRMGPALAHMDVDAVVEGAVALAEWLPDRDDAWLAQRRNAASQTVREMQTPASAPSPDVQAIDERRGRALAAAAELEARATDLEASAQSLGADAQAQRIRATIGDHRDRARVQRQLAAVDAHKRTELQSSQRGARDPGVRAMTSAAAQWVALEGEAARREHVRRLSVEREAPGATTREAPAATTRQAPGATAREAGQRAAKQAPVAAAGYER